MGYGEDLEHDMFDDNDEFDSIDFDIDGDLRGHDSKDRTIRGDVSKATLDFLDGIKDDKLEAAKDFLANSVPYQISGEIEEIKGLYGSVKEETEKSVKAIKSSAKEALGAVSKLVPKDSSVENILKKISDKLGDDDSSGGSKGPSKEEQQAEQIKAALAETLGEFKKADDVNMLIERDLEAKRHATTEELLKHIYTESLYTRKFNYDVANAYYRKSLELQFKQLYTQQELVEITKTSFNAFKVQYEAIVKNTALPDIIKLRKLPASTKLVEELKGKFRDDTVGSIYKSIDPIKSFQKNIVAKVKDFGENVAGGLAEASGMVNMVGEMLESGEEFGQSKTEMLTGMLLDSIKSKAAGYVGSKLINTPTGKKAQGELKTLMADPREAFKQLAAKAEKRGERGGLLGFLANRGADIAHFMGDAVETDRRSTLQFNKRDLDDATIFDNRAHQALVKVIPMLLGKIYGEIKSIRTGDGDPENNEIYYDNRTESFLTSKQITKNIKTRMASTVDKNLKPKVKYLLEFVVDTINRYPKVIGSKQLKLSNEMFDVICMQLTEYYLTTRNPIWSHKALQKVAGLLTKNKQTKAAALVKQMYTAFDKVVHTEDPDAVTSFSRYAQDIRTAMPNAHKEYKDLHEQGYTHILEKNLGVAQRSSTGSLDYNSAADDINIFSSVKSGGFRDHKPEDSDKKDVHAVTKMAQTFKEKGKLLYEKGKERLLDEEGKFNPKQLAKRTLKDFKDFLDKSYTKGAQVLKDGSIMLADGIIVTQDEIAKLHGMSPEERIQYIKDRSIQLKDAINHKAQAGFKKVDTKLSNTATFGIGKMWDKSKRKVSGYMDRAREEYNKQMDIVNKYLSDTGYAHVYKELKDLMDKKKQLTEDYLDDIEKNKDSLTEDELKAKEIEFNHAVKGINEAISSLINEKINVEKEQKGLRGFIGKVFSFGAESKEFITDTTMGQKIATARAFSKNIANQFTKEQIYGHIANGKAKLGDFVDDHVLSKMDKETKNKYKTIWNNTVSGAKEIKKLSEAAAKAGYEKIPDNLRKDLEAVQEASKEIISMAANGEVDKEKLEKYTVALKERQDKLVKELKELPKNAKKAAKDSKDKFDNGLADLKQWSDAQGVTEELKGIKNDVANSAKSIDQTLTRGMGTKAFKLLKAGANYLKKPLKTEEEAKMEYFSSPEFKAGLAPNFPTWCRLMGYRIKGAVKKSIQKFLGITRKLDKWLFKKTMGGLFKGTGKFGKVLKFGLKSGVGATWKTASLALDMLPFGMGQVMKLPLMVMGSAADAITKKKIEEQEADTGRKQGYLSRLNYFFKRRSADGNTGIVDTIKKNKTLRAGGIGLLIFGMMKMMGITLGDVAKFAGNTFNVIKDGFGKVVKGFKWAKEKLDKFLGWIGLGDTSSLTSGILGVLAAAFGIKFALNPIGTAFGVVKGVFKGGKGIGKLAFNLLKGTGKAAAAVTGVTLGTNKAKPKTNTLSNVKDGTNLVNKANPHMNYNPDKTPAGQLKAQAATNAASVWGNATPNAPAPKLGDKAQKVVKGATFGAGIVGAITVGWFIDKFVNDTVEAGEADWKILMVKGAGWILSTAVGAAIQKGFNYVLTKFNLIAKEVKVVSKVATKVVKEGGKRIGAKAAAKLATYAASCTGIGIFLSLAGAVWDLGWILYYVFAKDMSWKSAISTQILGVDIFSDEYKAFADAARQAAAEEEERAVRRSLLEEQLKSESEEAKQAAIRELEQMQKEDEMRAKAAEEVASFKEVLALQAEKEYAESTWYLGWTEDGRKERKEKAVRSAKEALQKKSLEAFNKLDVNKRKEILSGSNDDWNRILIGNEELKAVLQAEQDKFDREEERKRKDAEEKAQKEKLAKEALAKKQEEFRIEKEGTKKEKELLKETVKIKQEEYKASTKNAYAKLKEQSSKFKFDGKVATQEQIDKTLYPHANKLFKALDIAEQVKILKGESNEHDFSPGIIEMLRKEYPDHTKLAQQAPSGMPTGTPENYNIDKPNKYINAPKSINWHLLSPQFRYKLNAFAEEMYAISGIKLPINSGKRTVADQIRLWETNLGVKWTNNKAADIAAAKKAGKGIVKNYAYPSPMEPEHKKLLKQMGADAWRAKYAAESVQDSAHGKGTAVDVSVNSVMEGKGPFKGVTDVKGKPHPVLDPLLHKHGLVRPLTAWNNPNGTTREYWHWEDNSTARFKSTISGEVAEHAGLDAKITTGNEDSGLSPLGNSSSNDGIYIDHGDYKAGGVSNTMGGVVMKASHAPTKSNISTVSTKSTTTSTKPKDNPSIAAKAAEDQNRKDEEARKALIEREAKKREQQLAAQKQKEEKEQIKAQQPNISTEQSKLKTETTKATAKQQQAMTPSPTAANTLQPVKVVNDKPTPTPVPGNTTSTTATTTTSTPIVTKIDKEALGTLEESLKVQKVHLEVANTSMKLLLDIRDTMLAIRKERLAENGSTKDLSKTPNNKTMTQLPDPVIDLKRQERFEHLYT